MASSNLLAWLDLEMTGLDPEKHFIIEIACLVTDSDLNRYAISVSEPIDHPIDCAGTYYGDLELDDCGVCDGNGFSCHSVTLAFGEVTSESAEILYSSSVNIGGFQFDTDGVELTGVLSDFSDGEVSRYENRLEDVS